MSPWPEDRGSDSCEDLKVIRRDMERHILLMFEYLPEIDPCVNQSPATDGKPAHKEVTSGMQSGWWGGRQEKQHAD